MEGAMSLNSLISCRLPEIPRTPPAPNFSPHPLPHKREQNFTLALGQFIKQAQKLALLFGIVVVFGQGFDQHLSH